MSAEALPYDRNWRTDCKTGPRDPGVLDAVLLVKGHEDGLADVVAAMAWKFIVAGSTQKAADGRTVVLLAPAERALMLAEMRGFVERSTVVPLVSIVLSLRSGALARAQKLSV